MLYIPNIKISATSNNKVSSIVKVTNRKKEHAEASCPMDSILRMLMGPWTTYILWLLRSKGEMRFGQIKKQIPGISAKMLTERLRMLEEAKIISRKAEATIPPKVSYKFTERGEDLNKVLDAFVALANKWAKR